MFSLKECASFGIRILVKMQDDVLLQSYIHDFVFKNLGINIEPHGFISHLMLTIKDSGKSMGVKGVAYDVVALHFKYQVYRKLINNASTVLRLLNGIDSLVKYDSQKRTEMGVTNPIEMLEDSNFEVMGRYVLTTLYNAFHISIQHCQNQLDSFNSWNELYITMVRAYVHLVAVSTIVHTDPLPIKPIKSLGLCD
jgi:hypothetical protein